MIPKLKDIMVREVVTIEANATVRTAVRLMNYREIGCLVVVQDGKPTGVVTERDMMKRVLVASRDPRAVEVGEVMSKPLLSMKPEKKIEDAVKLMFKHKIKKLPVIENGRLVGLGTLTDLTNFMRAYIKKPPRREDMVIDTPAQETQVKPPEKKEKGPSRCAGYFGYLARRPKNAPIPEECVVCPKVLDCVMDVGDS